MTGKSKVEKLHQHALQRACFHQCSHPGRGCLSGPCDSVSDADFLCYFRQVLEDYLDDVMAEDSPLS